jgi:Ca2+-binding RTX toxin-like protein
LITGITTDDYGGTDTLQGIREVQGSYYDDVLIGSDKLASQVGLSGYPSNGTTFFASRGSDRIDGTLALASNNIYYNSGHMAGGTIIADFSDYMTASVIKSNGGADTLTNVQGIHGSIANDVLNGSPTNGPTGTFFNSISLHGRQGDDTINGFGLTINRVDYSSATAAVSVNLNAGTATDGLGGTDSLINVVRVRGSNFNDTIIGGEANDVLETPALGSHFLDGAGGVNQYRFSNSDWTTPTSVLIDLGTTPTDGSGYIGFVIKPAGITDTLIRFNQARGSDGDDTLYGTPGDDKLIGLAGNNILDGRGGSNTLEYGAAFAGRAPTHGVVVDLAAGRATNPWDGTDTITNFQGVIGTPFADSLTGSNQAETLTGGAGNDLIIGGGGRDTLDGGAGDDVILIGTTTLADIYALFNP